MRHFFAGAAMGLALFAGCAGDPAPEADDLAGEAAGTAGAAPVDVHALWMVDCRTHWGAFVVPADAVAPMLPPGFAARSPSGVAGEALTVPHWLRCNRWTAEGAHSTAHGGGGMAMQWIAVQPPEELRRPDGSHFVVPVAWVEGEVPLAALQAWAAPATMGEVTIEENHPAPHVATGVAWAGTDGQAVALLSRMDAANSLLFGLGSTASHERLFFTTLASEGPTVAAVVDFDAVEGHVSYGMRGTGDLRALGTDAFPCSPCPGLATHASWPDAGVRMAPWTP